MQDGDIVQVVLDVVQTADGNLRVVCKGVWPMGSATPEPLYEPGFRNVLQMFWGMQHSVNAFTIDAGWFSSGDDD